MSDNESGLGAEWEIRVIKVAANGDGDLEYLRVPVHQLEKDDLQCFLKALLARHSGLLGEEFVTRFVNKRRGKLAKNSDWDLRSFHDLDHKRYGYWCGQAPVFASASLPLNDNEVEFLKRNTNIV